VDKEDERWRERDGGREVGRKEGRESAGAWREGGKRRRRYFMSARKMARRVLIMATMSEPKAIEPNDVVMAL